MTKKRKRNKSKSLDLCSAEVGLGETITQDTASQTSKKKHSPGRVMLFCLMIVACLLFAAWLFTLALVFFTKSFVNEDPDIDKKISIASTIFVGLTFAFNLADSYCNNHK